MQQPLNQHGATRPDGLCPCEQDVGVPAGDVTVCSGHVRVDRRMAPLEGAVGVAGDALAALEDFHRGLGHAHVDLGARVLARHRVVVPVDLDVVVDADPRHLSFGVLVASLRQRAQGRLVHLGKSAGAAARQLLEGPLVHIEQQGPQCAIEFIEAEEELEVQPRQHPARNHQHAVFDFRFIVCQQMLAVTTGLHP